MSNYDYYITIVAAALKTWGQSWWFQR